MVALTQWMIITTYKARLHTVLGNDHIAVCKSIMSIVTPPTHQTPQCPKLWQIEEAATDSRVFKSIDYKFFHLEIDTSLNEGGNFRGKKKCNAKRGDKPTSKKKKV